MLLDALVAFWPLVIIGLVLVAAVELDHRGRERRRRQIRRTLEFGEWQRRVSADDASANPTRLRNQSWQSGGRS